MFREGGGEGTTQAFLVLPDNEARATTSMRDTPNLNDLAKRRLAQLIEVGLPSIIREPDDTLRLRLLDGREVHFRLGPEDWQYRYRGARRVPGSERMERAILAALVALEASPVDPGRKEGKASKVTRQGAHLHVGMQEAMKSGADELDAMQVTDQAGQAVQGVQDTVGGVTDQAQGLVGGLTGGGGQQQGQEGQQQGGGQQQQQGGGQQQGQ